MKILSKIKIKITSKMRALAEKLRALVKRLREEKYYFTLLKFASDKAPDYDHYLKEQLTRTLVKNSHSLLPRTEILVNLVLDKVSPLPDSKVLCVGCRNTAELDYFYSKGLTDITGVDLFSEDPHIQVMDMHNLDFGDNTFDIVYSSHSLEHSYNIEQVVREFIRVVRNQAVIAIEVPVRYKDVPIRYTTPEADRYDLKSVEGVINLFSNHKTKLLWSDDLEAYLPDNQEGTPIARVILRIEK